MKKINVLRGLSDLAGSLKPSVVTIGNFDGVHLGHQTVIATLLAAAKERGLPSTVITFEPLAKEYFAPDSARRLQPLPQRISRLEALGVEQVLVLPFNAALAAMSPEQFVKQILVDGLEVSYLSVGDDFRFGHQREGDFDYLTQAGQTHGFDVVAHDTFSIEGERVSSGRLRQAVQESEFALAATLLGGPYTISGKVALGDQRGRTIGFPTANILLDAQSYAVSGVYAVRVTLPDTQATGVANVGWRPTVDGQENRLEVHLFDYEANIYGQEMEVEFVGKIRDEKKFDSFDLLREQIDMDALAARAVFN